MKKNVLASALAVGVAGMAAADLVAPSSGFATNRVETGVTDVQTERILVAEDGVIHKSGGGTWTVPLSLLPQEWLATFAVQEGTLSFTFGNDDEPGQSTLPSSVSDKALIWVDADATETIVHTDGVVTKWYDRRETDISSPVYAAALTDYRYTNDSPVRAVMNGGVNAVYFGGLASGRSMRFVNPDGTDCDGHVSSRTAVRHVFAVMNISNSYGNVFGAYGASLRSPFRVGNDSSKGGSIGGHYFYSGREGNQSTLNEIMIHGRAYRNGTRIDPTGTYVQNGLQLIEAESRIFTDNTLVSAFFAGSSAKYCGGDYLCEAIAFTNILTDAERMAVSEYLMKKWLPTQGWVPRRVSLADGTKFTASVEAGDTEEVTVAMSGTGAAEKTGEGGLRIYNCTEAGGVEWDIKEGTLTLGAFGTVKAAPGSRLTAENAVAGPSVSVADASSEKSLEKAGNDRVAVNGVPAGVTKIAVEDGTLTVRSPRTDIVTARSAYEIPIRNGGFEEYAPVIAQLRPDGSRIESVNNMKGYGWNYAEGVVQVFDYDGWNTGTEGASRATRTAFHIFTRPPEGKCALFLRSLSSPTTVRSDPFTLPEEGDYELTFKMCGRESTAYIGGSLRVRLIGESSTTAYGPVYRLRYTYVDGYQAFRLKFPSMAAGNYRIDFYTKKGSYVTVIDDVHLYKVPEDPLAASRWKIPGGDFESVDLATGNAVCNYSVANLLEGWNFIQPGSWNKSLPAVGITTLAMTNTFSTRRGLLYNNSREPESGSIQLCMCGGGAVAETVLKPSAGTYRLEGFISRFGSYGVFTTVKAEIEREDGTITDLGSLRPENKMMLRAGWPHSFPVDGSESVTLRLTASGTSDRVDHLASGVFLDDLELVTATDLELFVHGDCEGVDGNFKIKSIPSTDFGGASGKVWLRNDTENTGVFGDRMVKGRKMLVIGNMTCLYEDVTLPFAGRYRLSFYAHSRLNYKTGSYGPNPVEVRVTAEGKTNVLGRVNTYNSEWTQRVYDFSVPSAGVYRVELQGLSNPESANVQKEAHIDAISLRQIAGTFDFTPPFDTESSISVAEGARLETSFSGTNVIRGMSLGGVRLRGIVDVRDHPLYLSGEGVFKVVPRGSVLTVR